VGVVIPENRHALEDTEVSFGSVTEFRGSLFGSADRSEETVKTAKPDHVQKVRFAIPLPTVCLNVAFGPEKFYGTP
jgi:hypothetical protein